MYDNRFMFGLTYTSHDDTSLLYIVSFIKKVHTFFMPLNITLRLLYFNSEGLEICGSGGRE